MKEKGFYLQPQLIHIKTGTYKNAVNIILSCPFTDNPYDSSVGTYLLRMGMFGRSVLFPTGQQLIKGKLPKKNSIDCTLDIP